MIDQSARNQGAAFGIANGQKVILYEPNDMRRRCDQSRHSRHVRTWSCKRLASLAIEEDEQCEGGGQHEHEIFRPKGHSNRDTEQQPMAEPSPSQRAMEGKSSQGP